MAPSAALWIATTFGTASTGTAISTLSGAAAANAALAWLGGGALAAGGGGMAAGSTLLALAGPIGWTIAGATLLSSILLFANSKKKQQKQKQEEVKAVKRNTEQLKESDGKIQNLLEKTRVLREELSRLYSSCLTPFWRNRRHNHCRSFCCGRFRTN
jgi:membrane protein implicated in regulation of membrane protease activity